MHGVNTTYSASWGHCDLVYALNLKSEQKKVYARLCPHSWHEANPNKELMLFIKGTLTRSWSGDHPMGRSDEIEWPLARLPPPPNRHLTYSSVQTSSIRHGCHVYLPSWLHCCLQVRGLSKKIIPRPFALGHKSRDSLALVFLTFCTSTSLLEM